MVSVKSPLAIRLVNGYWQKKNIKIFISGTPPSIHFYSWHCLPSGKTFGLAVLFILANLFMSGILT
jgi:hypothetical protein